MFNLIPVGATRPDGLTKNKDEKYHADFAKYCLSQANDHLHSKFVAKVTKNKEFYRAEQWNDTEDVDTFLKDDNNQDRNRIPLVMNVIRPMVEQYRGNAIRMNINFRVKGISPQVVNRRETKLSEMLYYSKIANKPGNPFSTEIKKRLPVGNNDAETRQQFENTYQDEIVENMNYLADYVSKRNRFIDHQPYIARDMAFAGVAIMKDVEYGGHQYFEHIQPEQFFFDRSAKKEDLTDASFQGDVPELAPSEIFEAHPDIKPEQRQAIERYSRHFAGSPVNYGGTTRIHTGKVPVYRVYWKDPHVEEFGYVLDQFGYEYLTKINCVYEGEDKPRYTDADLIESTSLKAKKLLRGKKKRRLYYDVLRFCELIPVEIIGSAAPNDDSVKELGDIILNWGIAPYQETEVLEFNSVKFPYKVHCWSYFDGEILSPIDDAIDPQRFINRVWSAAENMINNSRGSGTVIDETMVTDKGATERAMNQSKPVYINAKGRGIQNAVGSYDATVKNGVMTMYNIIDSMKASIKETTGMNEAMQGESMGEDQLVGVTKLMIQRGSLMQEPFYNAVTNIFQQCFQAIVTRGKRIYADNERSLAMAVGDDGVRVIKITKDYNLEDFRAFAGRENSDEILKNAANQMLLTFKQMVPPMLDSKRIAQLWDRSTPADVSRALRAHAMEQEELTRMQNEQNAKQETELIQKAQQEQQVNQNMMFEQQAREDVDKVEGRNHEMKKEILKGLQKIAPGNKKAEQMLIKKAEGVA